MLQSRAGDRPVGSEVPFLCRCVSQETVQGAVTAVSSICLGLIEVLWAVGQASLLHLVMDGLSLST